MSPLCDDKGQFSSMRFLMLGMGVTTWLMLDEVRHYLHKAAETTATVDWVGISAYITTLITLIGVVVVGKVKQKKLEQDEKDDSAS